ncbi:hypothetical protein L7F22_003871 [Adiantum nelumboides]|nr:hypothetical protein [Adiantum nelumboides]
MAEEAVYKRRKQVDLFSMDVANIIKECLSEDFADARNTWEGQQPETEVVIPVQQLMDLVAQYALNGVILFFPGTYWFGFARTNCGFLIIGNMQAKKLELQEIQLKSEKRKLEVEALEMRVKLRVAEAEMFQVHADDARHKAEVLRRVVAEKVLEAEERSVQEQHIQEALQLLRVHLKSFSSIPSCHAFTVITGCFKKPKSGHKRIREEVVGYLERKGYKWVERSPFCLQIQMNKRDG